MRNIKLFSLGLILCLILGLGSACASQPAVTDTKSDAETTAQTTAAPAQTEAQETEAVTEGYDDGSLTGLPSPFSYDSLSGLSGEDWANAALEKNAAARAEYTASRFTTASGVTVQKVPNDSRVYNVAVLNAEQRGCNSCHDLSTALEWLPMSHPQLANEYASEELTVDMCYTCHVYINHAEVVLADSMHSLHMNSEYFQEMNGNCLSCHHIDSATGEYVLWDHVKYNVMTGITTISAENAVVEASYRQDVLTATEDMYEYWEAGDKSGITNIFTEDEEILNNWTIAISGAVENPGDYSLKEFLDTYKQYEVTEVRTMHCMVDGVGANQIAQVEVTGIPTKYFLEYVGYTGGEGTYCIANTVGTDGMAWSGWLVLDEAGLVVYEMNGETLPANLGYPVQFFQANGAPSATYCKAPVSMELVVVEGEAASSVGLNPVNCGIINYRDGQVFQMGDEIVFEGHAHAFGNQVVSVEYSLDLGQTWITLDTTDSEVGPWVYWYLKIEPQSVGSYVLQVRATDVLGNTVSVPVWSLFHVE